MLDNSLIKSFAEYYHYKLGFNVTCISNRTNIHNLIDNSLFKAPNHEWKQWSKNKQTEFDFKSLNWDSAIGVGVVLGYNNLIAIDFDDCINDAIIKLACEKLAIPFDYEWIINTGSGAGYHIILNCDLSNSHQEIELFKNKFLENLTSDTYNFKRGAYNDTNLSAINDFFNQDVKAYTVKKFKAFEWGEGLGAFCNNNLFENRNLYLNDLAKKIEFKIGGHLVLPPSFHQSGIAYKFKNSIPQKKPLEVSLIKLLEFYTGVCGVETSTSGSFCDLVSSDILNKENNKKIRVLFFDTETNGLNSNNEYPEMLQIAWYICEYVNTNIWISGDINKELESKIVKKKTYLVKNINFEIDTNAQFIHEINQDKLETLGEDLRKIITEFLNDINSVTLIVSHNFDFNKEIILKQLFKLKMNNEDFINKLAFCTMKNTYYNNPFIAEICKNNFEKKWYGIDELYYKLYEIKIDVKHNSLHDCLVLIACFDKLINWDLISSHIN